MLNGDKAAQATEKFKNYVQLMKWCAQATRLSVRTNAEAVAQLRVILAPHGYTVLAMPVPESLHFKSNLTWAGGDVLVCTPSMADLPELKGYRLVVVPQEEAYAANVLWINGTVLMPKGFRDGQPIEAYLPAGNAFADSITRPFANLRCAGIQCGHFIPEEQPQWLASLLAGFLIDT